MKLDKLYLAWVIALSGLLLSFYYGEVLDLEPCRLCWYQRMAIFPLALFLGIASYKSNLQLALYSLPLSLFGLLIASYQSLIQIFPILHSERLCGATQCTDQGMLPFLSMLGFALMTFLIYTSTKQQSLAKNDFDSGS